MLLFFKFSILHALSNHVKLGLFFLISDLNIISCLNDETISLNNTNKFDVYYSDHPKHGKIYPRKDL